MDEKHGRRVTRRSFLKGSATGIAGTVAGVPAFGAAPMLYLPKTAVGLGKGESPHPNISGFRVVGIHDKKMTTEESPVCPWRSQQKLVDDAVVEDNVDAMAMALTEEKNISDAWKAIFVKPAGKSWSDVVVAIKTNNIARQHTRTAVMRKICRVLVDEIGVKGSRIFIYDGCHGADMTKKTPFEDLPDGCHIASRWGKIKSPVPIPSPWKEGGMKADCMANLAANEADILVNIALCKGHYPRYGAFTMTMKNHLGTFDPRWAHEKQDPDNQTNYLFGINRTPEVVGEIDPGSGKVLFPRQQLCLIDAIWASEKGPMCDTSHQPNRLFMGTFSPVLDYHVARRFRKNVMKWAIDETVTERFLTDFGFEKSDLIDQGKIIDAKKA